MIKEAPWSVTSWRNRYVCRHIRARVTFSLRSFLGAKVFYHRHLLTGKPFEGLGLHGVVDFQLHVDRLPLPEGRYALDAYLSRDSGHTLIDVVDGLLGFEVCDGDFFGTGASYIGGPNPAVMVDGRCTAEEVPAELARRPEA